MMNFTTAQREAIAATREAPVSIEPYAERTDVVRVGGDALLSTLRDHTAMLAHAIETVTRLKVAFEGTHEISEEARTELEASYQAWARWLSENEGIADKVMDDMARFRRTLKKSAPGYETAIAGVTAIEITLMQAHNARVDVVIYLRTLIDRFSSDKKNVGYAKSAKDVDAFFDSLGFV